MTSKLFAPGSTREDRERLEDVARISRSKV